MSTVITRMLKRLVVGKSDAGRVAVDDRGRNVWIWNDSDAAHAGTTTLLKRLDNDDLDLADTQIWKKDKLNDGLEERRAAGGKNAAASGTRLSIEETGRRKSAIRAGKAKNRFGKLTDEGGGFNPYG